MVARMRLMVRFCLVGRCCSQGKTGLRRNTIRPKRLLEELEKDSKTSMIGVFTPSRAWKSCPKPAMPIESRLERMARFKRVLRLIKVGLLTKCDSS